MHRASAVPLFLSFLLICPDLSAQTVPQKSNAIIVAETKLVPIFVTVLNDKGQLAQGLKETDFQIFIDGIPQSILSFSDDGGPISYLLVGDTSQSMSNKTSFVQGALHSILDIFPDTEEHPDPNDFALIVFGTRASRLVFSRPGSNRELFFTNADELGPMIDTSIQPTKESTALFDAVYLGLQYAREGANKRRVMIIITDGGDNYSRYNLKDTRRFAEEADIPIFSVMASPSLSPLELLTAPVKSKPKKPGDLPDIKLPGGRSLDGDRNYIGPNELQGPSNLKTLADATGGAVFTATNLGEDDLGRIARMIVIAARYGTYVLSVRPERLAGIKHPKDWDGTHKVEVKFFSPEAHKGYQILSAKRHYKDPSP